MHICTTGTIIVVVIDFSSHGKRFALNLYAMTCSGGKAGKISVLVTGAIFKISANFPRSHVFDMKFLAYHIT
jgi:hypothetical protein